MRQKLRKHNQAWISRQLQRAKKETMPLSFFINFSSIRVAACNGERLKRRGRLKPDWNLALFHQGWGEMPIVGPGEGVYWFEVFDKEQLPGELMPLWEDA
ncbi:hypothetical protein ABR39_09995 [Enterobacter genomosp. O]|uniref:hypothetical protein n=1 Tax=Enterobacter genomosp. O TaxID=2364150 RepID=UPI000642A406|nr:hypothetical protein [Enterobacter genomosp. O]KLP55228.1 hypothetical protein ABR39_09995 [Enterobacter genomosp. O]